jgi:lipopolysaccharide cholinephosphotransferase
MVYLEYNIFGINKKIKIESMDHDDSHRNNVVKHNDKHYEYIVGPKEQKTFKKLLKILKLWNELAKEHDVEYWACAGTLLGAVRHSGFIPWDNDIDISIMLSDVKRVKMILEQHPILTCCECELGIQVRYRDYEFPFMDIYVCDYYDKNIVKYCGFLSKYNEPTWFMDYYFPNEHVYKKELYPLKEINFEDTTIMVPNIQKNMLFRTYSDKCLTSCKIVSNTDFHELCSKKIMEKRYHYLKNIYEVERIVHLPTKIMFTSVHYKLLKKIENKYKYNSGNNRNKLFNKLIIKTVENINYLCN